MSERQLKYLVFSLKLLSLLKAPFIFSEQMAFLEGNIKSFQEKCSYYVFNRKLVNAKFEERVVWVDVWPLKFAISTRTAVVQKSQTHNHDFKCVFEPSQR